MIGGGKWDAQNKKLNGVYINFVSKKASKTKTTIVPVDPIDPDDDPSTDSLWLKDVNGLLFRTSDGFNIAVRI